MDASTVPTGRIAASAGRNRLGAIGLSGGRWIGWRAAHVDQCANAGVFLPFGAIFTRRLCEMSYFRGQNPVHAPPVAVWVGRRTP
jgi:hypothetical protein